MKMSQKGFTLIEILIVIALIILLSMFVLMNLRGQQARATDIKRKTDLYALRKSFEEYANDHAVFPDQTIVDTCGSAALMPYLSKVPCDPVSKDHYGYFPSQNGGYRICAKLSDTTDPAITSAGCTGPAGCGLGGPSSGGVYNYCLSSGVTASAVGTVDEIAGGGGSTPTPTPTPTPDLNPAYHIACTLGGDCNWYDNPSLHGCPISWQTSCPPGACALPANRCAD